MIKCNKDLRIIDFLNNHYPTSGEVYVRVCDGHDSIEAPDGTRAFGVFIPSASQIYVAEDLPEKEYTLPHTIAHEYRHYLQFRNTEPIDEQDAEDFADGIMQRLQEGE